MVNRGGPGNRSNNRRVQGGFQNRGSAGVKTTQKQSTGGIRKQNAFDRAKKLLAKNATNKKKDSASGDKKIESKESPYASVPNDMFYCHLCKKHMWDANSFENHIKGRTHLMMREGIEESYRLKANMIRQEAKIAEQLKSIELDRLKRMGKSKQRMLEYCTMCDLNFHGHISAHRKSEGHLQLKKFLHPKCIECNKEFATRIDYDSHLLSADHLKKAAEKNTKVGEPKRNTLTILGEDEEFKDIRPPQKKKKKSAKKADGTTTEGGVEIKKEVTDDNPDGGEDTEGGVSSSGAATEEADKKEGTGGDDGETKDGGDELNETQEEEEEAVLPVDGDDCILDYAEGDEIPTEVENRLPKYNWTRAVGNGLITKLECYECSVCSKFFDTEKTVEIHSRTVTHHRNFLKFINEKSSDTKIAQKRAAAALEESERRKRKLEEVTTASNTEENTENGENGEATSGEVNNELYDPSEATGDDEDFDTTEQNEEIEEIPDDDENGGDVDEIDMLDEDDSEIDPELEAQLETEIDRSNDIIEPPKVDPPKVETPVKTVVVKTPAPAPAASPAPAPAPAPAVVASPAPAPTSTPGTPVAATNVGNTTTTPTTPAAAATPTTTSGSSGGGGPPPAKRMNLSRGGTGAAAGAKPSPRNRGRGRYSRY